MEGTRAEEKAEQQGGPMLTVSEPRKRQSQQ